MGYINSGIHAFIDLAIAVMRISVKALCLLLCRRVGFAHPYSTDDTVTAEYPTLKSKPLCSLWEVLDGEDCEPGKVMAEANVMAAGLPIQRSAPKLMNKTNKIPRPGLVAPSWLRFVVL